ncbi:hypothetical protein ACJ3XI_01595 [Litorimonas sp. RW-G-Af-16]|uniref:hypothetical protein n=1 Tax=Litorimonas sp. RW-G-Af-16 TaxID=3241168 RepID=UPI00390C62E9
MQDDLFFIHVPKCQGTTLSGMIAASHTAAASVTSEQVDLFTILFSPATDIARYKYIGGHYPNWFHQAKFPNKHRMIVVRDPLKRFKSIMKHGHRDAAFQGHLTELWKTDKPLNVFKDKNKLALWLKGASVASYCASAALPTFASVEAFYENTMAQIDQFEHLISDLDFDDYFLNIAFQLNMPPLENVPNIRSSKIYAEEAIPKFKGLDAATLKKYIPGEYELYDRVVAASSKSKPTRPNYEQWQKKYNQYWRTKTRSDYICFTPDMAFKGYGWYPRRNLSLESEGIHFKFGLQFDQSGAFLDLPLDTNMKTIRGMIYCVDPIIKEGFKVMINGVTAAVTWPISSIGSVHSFSVQLSRELLGDLYTRVELSYEDATTVTADVFLLELLAH